jgi:hypothetical protein
MTMTATVTTDLTVTAKIESVSSFLEPLTRHCVWFVWDRRSKPLDRPVTSGISCGSDRALADRLAKAINAGAVTHDVRVTLDSHGQSYVSHGCKVAGRNLSRDLANLGF